MCLAGISAFSCQNVFDLDAYGTHPVVMAGQKMMHNTQQLSILADIFSMIVFLKQYKKRF